MGATHTRSADARTRRDGAVLHRAFPVVALDTALAVRSPRLLSNSTNPGNLPVAQLFPLLEELTIITPRKKHSLAMK